MSRPGYKHKERSLSDYKSALYRAEWLLRTVDTSNGPVTATVEGYHIIEDLRPSTSARGADVAKAAAFKRIVRAWGIDAVAYRLTDAEKASRGLRGRHPVVCVYSLRG